MCILAILSQIKTGKQNLKLSQLIIFVEAIINYSLDYEWKYVHIFRDINSSCSINSAHQLIIPGHTESNITRLNHESENTRIQMQMLHATIENSAVPL